MKQTAVQWLVYELQKAEYIPKDSILIDYVIKQAKEIEKHQIIGSNIAGMEFIAVDPNKYNADALKYYEETYTQSSE